MKRILALTCGMLLANVALAGQDWSSVFSWTTNADGITITGYRGTGGDVTIPSVIDGTPVVAIGDSAFYTKSTITSVTVEEGVLTIGNNAFYSCNQLASVRLAPTITSIGASAFASCGSLTSIVLPSSLQSLGRYVFGICLNLESIYFLGDYSDGLLHPEGGDDTQSMYPEDQSAGLVLYHLSSASGWTSDAFPDFSKGTWDGEVSVTFVDEGSSVTKSLFAGSAYGQDLPALDDLAGNARMWALSEEGYVAAVTNQSKVLLTVEPYSLYAVLMPLLLPDAMEMVSYSHTFTGGEGSTWHMGSGLGTYVEEIAASSGFDSSVCVAMGWQDDDEFWALELPFTFTYFGEEYDEIYVGSNGTIAFAPSSSYGWDLEEDFLSVPMIAAYLSDLTTEDGDIYVESDSTRVTIRWDARLYYSEGDDAAAFSATLHADGRIALSYGCANDSDAVIGLSAGDGATKVISARSGRANFNGINDLTFSPAPESINGLSLSGEGVLSGYPENAGDFILTITEVPADGEAITRSFHLTVAANPNQRPAIDDATPEEECVNLGPSTQGAFSVSAHDPEGVGLSYVWMLDDERQDATQATFTLNLPASDYNLHSIVCYVNDDLWHNVVSQRWEAGRCAITAQPQGMSVSLGGTARLSVGCSSPWDADGISWYSTDDEETVVGSGASLVISPVEETRSYYAIVSCNGMELRSDNATVTADTALAVGRVYKLTGPAFVGNRLVLAAQAFGDTAGATYAWKRNGVVVSANERLDIASITPADFGKYTLTIANGSEEVTSAQYVLKEARGGTVVSFGSDYNHTGCLVPPPGLDGVAMMSSGNGYNYALTTNGTVAAWGSNAYGQCDVPEGMTDVSFVAAYRACYESRGAGFAVTRNGEVVGWGQTCVEYDDGEGGSYTVGVDLVAGMPADLSDVVQVAAGVWCGAIALKADGTVVFWGKDASYADVSMPGVLRDIVSVAASPTACFALKADGTIMGWGRGEGVDSIPADISDVASFSVAQHDIHDFGVAVRFDGTIATWGPNVGDYYMDECVPEDESGVVDVGASGFVGLDLHEDGSVLCWGPGDGDEWWDQEGFRLLSVTYAPEEGMKVIGMAGGLGHWSFIVAPNDTTSRGVPHSWIVENGLVGAGASTDDYESSDLLDTDGDGMANWEEYVAGTSPTNALSRLMASVSVADGAASVSWSPDLGGERIYTVEAADAVGGPWSEVEAITPADGATKRFFRVKVELP